MHDSMNNLQEYKRSFRHPHLKLGSHRRERYIDIANRAIDDVHEVLKYCNLLSGKLDVKASLKFLAIDFC